MVLDLVLHSACNRALTLFDPSVHELFDLAAIQAHDVIVMLALVQLENSGGAFEVMSTDQSRGFELGQDSIHGRKPDVLVRLQEMLVDIFSTHVPWRRSPENFENFQPWQRDFEAGFAQIIRFDWFHIRPTRLPLRLQLLLSIIFQPLSRRVAELDHPRHFSRE